MRHFYTETSEAYPITLLIKSTAFNSSEIVQHYFKPLEEKGVNSNEIIAFTAEYPTPKTTAKQIKEYLGQLLPELYHLGTRYIYVADGAYFKQLTGKTKIEPWWNYVLPCVIPGYEHMQVVLGLNHKALFRDPAQAIKITRGLDTLVEHIKGTYKDPGSSIIHSEHYPDTNTEIKAWLNKLLDYPELAADIEGFSLNPFKAGIGTISFAWDKHNGIAFTVDLSNESYSRRKLLHQFFESYKGNLTWHGSTYDLKAIIFALWMKDPLDIGGMLTGLHVMTRSFNDTKTIAYLATNTTAGNHLGLKALAHEFAGNWAVDEIEDIRKIPIPDLLRYNLVDSLSTNYVKEKYFPIMVADNQEVLYKTLMLPSLKTIIQMELVGMPIHPGRLREVERELLYISKVAYDDIMNQPYVKITELLLQQSAMEKANAKLKTKQHPLSKFADLKFNPNSGHQLREIFYKQFGLPVIDKTDSGLPAVGAETLTKLVHHAKDESQKALLNAVIAYGKVEKILSTFIKAFNNGEIKADDCIYLHGSFNLGGTVSGRLSSSDPNLQNLPANSLYGKLVKTIFQAPPGWIFAGADFASLEDRINALLTKDPNKLKVYTEGYDGHCLRAFAYFPEQMPDIVDTVESINSIASKYKSLRQESKMPTFALTYLGTWLTLMRNLGWSEEKAKQVEANYKALYKVSLDWVQDKVTQASRDGYCDVAFGLRIRTPVLEQCLMNSSVTPKEAAAEARTLGNAVSGQSYGLLNNRAMNAVMERVWDSEFAQDILPVAQIHDAQYYLIRDDARVVEFANRAITEEMRWQELPEIAHDQVKVFANLDLFYPTWADPITLPEHASADEIRKICQEALEKRDDS